MPYWSSNPMLANAPQGFQKRCGRKIGEATYSAALMGLPWGQSWEDSCNSTSATLPNGQKFAKPSRCKKTYVPGTNIAQNIWGEWDVTGDKSCTPYWAVDPIGEAVSGFPNAGSDHFIKVNCGDGFGQANYKAYLMRIPDGMSWEETCKKTPATINGKTFAAPDYCKKDTNIWGYWGSVPLPEGDKSCTPYWGEIKKKDEPDGCAKGDPYAGATYHSILWNVTGTQDWKKSCEAMPPLTLPVTTDPNQKTKKYLKPTRCNKTLLNVWAEWDGVPDKTCLPYWGPYRLKGCGGLFTSVYEAKLMNLGTDPSSWEKSCKDPRVPSIEINGKTYDKPDRCVIDDAKTGIWGQWDVFDPVQCPPKVTLGNAPGLLLLVIVFVVLVVLALVGLAVGGRVFRKMKKRSQD